MKATSLGHLITLYLNSKGLSVTPKKLQKLIYYVEAWHLVHFEGELLDENFEAWVHGPVIPSLYQNLKKYGYNNLKVIENEDESVEVAISKIATKSNLSDNQLELIFSVLNKYGTLNSFELEMLSHNESPWIEAREGVLPHERCNNVIDKKRMKEFYSAQLKE